MNLLVIQTICQSKLTYIKAILSDKIKSKVYLMLSHFYVFKFSISHWKVES